MIISILALLVGLVILGGGLYYLIKEKSDHESRNIYIITAIAGAAVFTGAAVSIVISVF